MVRLHPAIQVFSIRAQTQRLGRLLVGSALFDQFQGRRVFLSGQCRSRAVAHLLTFPALLLQSLSAQFLPDGYIAAPPALQIGLETMSQHAALQGYLCHRQIGGAIHLEGLGIKGCRGLAGRIGPPRTAHAARGILINRVQAL